MALVCFGYGNPSRGDDALGPLLLERLEDWLQRHPNKSVETIGDFQLQIEHTLDLRDRDLALFVDADASCMEPFVFTPASPSLDASYTTHELSPGALLQVYHQVEEQAPPPAFILGVRGERFELGEPLSPQASAHLEAAWHFLKELVADARLEAWTRKVTLPHA